MPGCGHRKQRLHSPGEEHEESAPSSVERSSTRTTAAGHGVRSDRRSVDDRYHHRSDRRRGAWRTVTATNQATNVAYTAVSNNAGNYTITSVPVGTYVVKAELPGFKTAATKPIAVEAKQIVRLDFKLELGAVEETVEVAATSPVLQTETATVGEVISGHDAVACRSTAATPASCRCCCQAS